MLAAAKIMAELFERLKQPAVVFLLFTVGLETKCSHKI